MELTNSKRVLRSASYVVTELTPPEVQQMEAHDGRALEKINFIRQAAIRPEDIESARERMVREGGGQEDRVRRGFDMLNRVVRAVSAAEGPAGTNLSLAPLAAAISTDVLIGAALTAGERVGMPAMVALSVEAFRQRMHTAPVGRLHLERLEMYPAGIQRGELMFTVPLAPKETITISHKEWSTSGEEYERIVQDYFESYSERGVAEKTDVSMSTESESKRASVFNFSANMAGGYGPVSMSVSTGLSTTKEDRQALKESTQRSREVTEKASARTRQEHKVSAKLEAKRGMEDSAYRTITNPLNQASRIDYYRLMRKWRTDLFRYGLRLTFDIAIPTPGARLWALHRRVRELDRAIGKPFVFPLTPEAVPEVGWQGLAATYGATIDAPPPATITISISRALQDPKGGNEIFDFVAPDGYVMRKDSVICEGVWASNPSDSSVGPATEPYIIFPPYTTIAFAPNTENPPGFVLGGSLRLASQGLGGGKHASWFLIYMPVTRLLVDVRMDAVRLDTTLATWRVRSWTTLRDAAFAAYQAEIARLQAERDHLWMLLAGKDTLTLRRLEREELIRETLYWLIGADFDPTPPDVAKVFAKLVRMEQEQLPDDWPGADMFRRLNSHEWATAAGFGDFVKFIHHAVEWESILYFLYPYFWGSDDLAREKMLFEHPDPNHREFLRAGYARVVVPIRPGYEAAFTTLLDTGIFSGPGTSPYLTIAEEVAAFARTNYAAVPPANPERHARPLLYPEQRRTWETMQAVVSKLEAHAQAQHAYPASLSELPGAPFNDAWGHALVYRNPGTGNDYDLLSLGADGVEGGEGLDTDISAGAGASLVATWFEYTPTSGIDIDLDVEVDKIA
jgi:hypothetical protein